MNKHLRLLAVPLVSVLVACGSSSESGPPALNTAFAGTWYGTTTVAFSGGPTLLYTSQLVIAVSGNVAAVAEVCPDGTGSVQAQGSGNSATWSGTLVCPAVSVLDCAAVTFSYQQATATLGPSGNSLVIVATGSATGCGTTYAMTVTFTSP